MKILSFDPGLRNMAFCLVRTDPTPKILRLGTINKPLSDLTKGKVQLSVTLFCDEIKRYLKKVRGEDVVVIERWMPRGRAMGVTAEAVNMMIGIIFTLCSSNFELVTASAWKTYFNRHYKTKEDTILSLIKNDELTDHQADALGIIAHYMETKMNYPKAWKQLRRQARRWK